MTAPRRRGAARQGRAQRAGGQAVLRDILCGVDGTRTAYEAVRQAASLAGKGGRLTLLAVVRPSGAARDRAGALARAKRRLAHARGLAEKYGVRAEVLIDERGPVAKVLLERAEAHGLLALGAPAMSRHAHLLIGGVATQAAHVLPASLLVARRAPAKTAFGERIIVANDALDGSDALLGFAITLARQRKATLVMLHAASAESRFHPTRIARQSEDLGRALGQRSRTYVVPGRAKHVILETAAREDASLIVIGSRGVRGVRALGSVSERVVHEAPCSVLVVRPEDCRG
jgi:nucleotide-binding universal stress UspA family protein